MMMKKIIVFLFLIGLVSMASQVSAVQYSFTDLGHLGSGGARARGMNDLGQVVGTTSVIPYVHPGFLWENGTMTELGYLSGTKSTTGIDINNSGIIVGNSSLGSLGGNWQAHLHAFRWENGTLVDLGTTGGRQRSTATGINESGVIVGYSANGTDLTDRRAFVWENGIMTDLNQDFGTYQSVAYGINDVGQIIAWASDSPGWNDRSYLWDNGTVTDLGDFGGGVNFARDINNQGQIVGYSKNSSGEYRSYLWQDGVLQDIGSLGGTHTEAEAINELGQIVGRSQTSSGEWHPFIWENGIITDLYEFIIDQYSWTIAGIDSGMDINESGQLLASLYFMENTKTRGFILTPSADPIPEPTTMLLLGSGLVGLAGFRRRFKKR